MLFCLPLMTSAYTCGNGVKKSFGKGEEVPVCVHFKQTPSKLLFLPRLDIYSAVEGKGAFSYFRTTAIASLRDLEALNQTDFPTDNSTNPDNTTDPGLILSEVSIAIQVSGSNLTTWAPYINAKLVAPVFSVVVDVNDGEIHSVDWDNSCRDCSSDCLKGNGEDVCALPRCANLTSPDCDPKVYVSWIGKDKNGLSLESAGHRISAFRKFSLYDAYDSANKDF